MGTSPAAEEKPEPGRNPTRAALHLAEVGVRVHVHLHLAELQVAVGRQREHRAHGIHALLHHVGEAHGLLDGALPAGLVHLPAEEGVLVAVIVVGLEHQLLAVLDDELGQVDRSGRGRWSCRAPPAASTARARGWPCARRRGTSPSGSRP